MPESEAVVVGQMVASLKAQVAAAREEFDLALIFHSVWKPTAFDRDLHRRMGSSFASQGFLVVRNALQREMLLALIRLWDTNRDAVRLLSIKNILMDKRVIAALASANSVSGISPWVRDQIEATIAAKAKEAIALIDTYSSEEERSTALANLKLLRDKVLAHRQVKKHELPEQTATGEQIERFMTDMTRLIGLLSSIAHATSYDPQETAEIYDYHAELFWAPAKGERTEGHPRFRSVPTAGGQR